MSVTEESNIYPIGRQASFISFNKRAVSLQSLELKRL